MKKLFAIIILIALSMRVGCAQSLYDTLAQPNHIVGRTINESGEITNEYPADFSYNSNNDLFSFVFPEHSLTSQFFYDHQLLHFYVMVYSLPEFNEHYYVTHEFEYENGVLQMDHFHSREYTNDDYDDNYCFYTYENGLLVRKDEGYAPNHICHFWTYEYDSLERIYHESYYVCWGCPGITRLKKLYTYQYDNGLLRETLIEVYNDTGDYQIIETNKQTYSYTEEGKIASEIKQSLNDNGEWVNNTIHNYLYGGDGRIDEQQDGNWSEELNDWNITKKVIHEYSNSNTTYTVSFYKKSGDEWAWDEFRGQTLFFEPELKWQQSQLENYFNVDYYNRINQIEFSMTNTITSSIPKGSEWYYEILNDDGSVTYQHLECTGDTVMQGKRPKVIVRSNTHYDRDETEVSHEYIYGENGIIYWWNRELNEFTTLYNLNAEAGDSWEIKVGNESITMHVDAVENIEYEGSTYRLMHISDPQNLFSGDIMCGIGHLTSFFPEKLMRNTEGFRVDGLRCYWLNDELIYHEGDEDCDAIHSVLQSINEPSDNAAFAVYPNPTNGILVVETRRATSLPTTTYSITNLMGQTLLTGTLNTVETFPETSPKQIDISGLPAGMYFITVDGQTVKFVVK